MMIKPEMLPDLLKPTLAPERIFVEPMKVEPGFVGDPIQQNTLAPLLSGISSAAGSFASIDYGGLQNVPGPTSNPYAGSTPASYYTNPSYANISTPYAGAFTNAPKF